MTFCRSCRPEDFNHVAMNAASPMRQFSANDALRSLARAEIWRKVVIGMSTPEHAKIHSQLVALAKPSTSFEATSSTTRQGSTVVETRESAFEMDMSRLAVHLIELSGSRLKRRGNVGNGYTTCQRGLQIRILCTNLSHGDRIRNLIEPKKYEIIHGRER